MKQRRQDDVTKAYDNHTMPEGMPYDLKGYTRYKPVKHGNTYYCTATYWRQNQSEIQNRVVRDLETIVILAHGRPLIVLVPPAEYAALKGEKFKTIAKEDKP